MYIVDVGVDCRRIALCYKYYDRKWMFSIIKYHVGFVIMILFYESISVQSIAIHFLLLVNCHVSKLFIDNDFCLLMLQGNCHMQMTLER